MACIPDPYSQANLGGSIEEIDELGCLVVDKMCHLENEDIEEVDILEVSNVDVQKPIIGKIFATTDEAYTFYNNYALTKGFGTRKFWNSKSRSTRQIIRVVYVCNKQGKKPFGGRRCTRTGCMAKMEIVLTKDGSWTVDKFNDIHNHIITPTKVMKHRSHKKFTSSDACKSLMSKFHEAGLRPSLISRAVNSITGSQEVDVTPKQCSDYLSVERKNNVGRECYGIIKHFQEKSMIDGSYYFTMDLAKNGSFRSVFWADGRSREAYSQFGDVVVFDVTYKTNKFMFPFAPFVGVNHHRQSILFAAALLEDEREETFVWVFEQFLKCMFDRPPISIITDQDGAIYNAIKKVFPDVHHRFCDWHIKKHVFEHLQPLRSRYADFYENFKRWIKSSSIETLEKGWENLNEKYEIEKNGWLTNMYNLRQHWVKAYLKNTFFAGMITSGRSESINAFFDGYVNANTTLTEFVRQYDKAIKSCRDAEEDEDFRTINSEAVLLTTHGIEEHAGRIYTRNIFELFKVVWNNSFSCAHEKLSKDGFVIKYLVGVHNIEKDRWKNIEFQSNGDIVAKCSCAKFETEGLLCKHILYILRKKQIQTIPMHYILHRWTIDARYQVNNVGFEVINTLNSNDIHLPKECIVRAKFSRAIEDARNSSTDMQELDLLLSNYLQNLAAKKKASLFDLNAPFNQIDSITSISRLEEMDHISIRDPTGPVRTKGRPKTATRLRSGLERQAEAKKKRTCGACGEKGHYRTGCRKQKDEDGRTLQ